MQQMGSMNNSLGPMRRLHPWRMVSSGVVILIAGITIGVAGTMMFGRSSEYHPPDPNTAVAHMIPRFQDQLNLTPEQVDKIKTILGKGFVALDEIRTTAQPKIEKALQTTMDDIEKVLSPEQRSDWQRIAESLTRRFNRGMGPGFGPGRGGPRGGGRGDWPGGPGGERGRREFGPGEPDGPPPWAEGFRPGDPNGPRGDRPPWFDRPRGPNDVDRPAWRDRHDANEIRAGDHQAGKRTDPNGR
jgi:Spy/CpxP family protein refolding chaperone